MPDSNPESLDQQPAQTNRLFRFLLPLIAATVGGFLAGLAILPLGDTFGYPPEIQAVVYEVNANLDFQEIKQLDRQILLKNTTLSACVAGMLVVSLLGLAAGLSGARRGALFGFGQGLGLGAVGGALGGFVGAMTWQFMVDNEYMMETSSDTSTHAAIANAILWACIGVAGGIAVQVRGNRQSSIIAGLMGGGVAALLFFLMASFVLTSAKLDSPIPENVNETPWMLARLMWALIPGVIIGLFIARATAFHNEHNHPKDGLEQHGPEEAATAGKS